MGTWPAAGTIERRGIAAPAIGLRRSRRRRNGRHGFEHHDQIAAIAAVGLGTAGGLGRRFDIDDDVVDFVEAIGGRGDLLDGQRAPNFTSFSPAPELKVTLAFFIS